MRHRSANVLLNACGSFLKRIFVQKSLYSMFALLSLLCSVLTELRRPPWATESSCSGAIWKHPSLALPSIYYRAQVCTVCLFPGLFWLTRTQRKGPVRWNKATWSAPFQNSASLGPRPAHSSNVPTNIRRCTRSCAQLRPHPLTHG